MYRLILVSLGILAFACQPISAQTPDNSPDALLLKLDDPNPHIRESAALRLGKTIDPDKSQPPADADAIKAKLGDFYKAHRTELNHSSREYLCMILYPDIKRTLQETIVSEYPVTDISVTDLFKGLNTVAKRSGAPAFDFTTIRIDASVDPQKLNLHTSNSFLNATGLQVLKFIAVSVGGRYDVDDTGVFIYTEPKPPAPVVH